MRGEPVAASVAASHRELHVRGVGFTAQSWKGTHNVRRVGRAFQLCNMRAALALLWHGGSCAKDLLPPSYALRCPRQVAVRRRASTAGALQTAPDWGGRS
eukprot:TRINITY_DN23226_c4_g1_i1.p4 TRINITY_DN23226_c4_g1~~TRINITY_DN23226_c4_g1_i1.p4  ORF type:complete len:100 (-),score=0.20 TRINITY_DN23226_c4_g1_i1:622-921(-)